MTPLEVSVTGGELAEVTVADSAGTPVPGSIGDSPDDPGAELWTPETPLAYGTGYTVTATAANDEQEAVT